MAIWIVHIKQSAHTAVGWVSPAGLSSRGLMGPLSWTSVSFRAGMAAWGAFLAMLQDGALPKSARILPGLLANGFLFAVWLMPAQVTRVSGSAALET